MEDNESMKKVMEIWREWKHGERDETWRAKEVVRRCKHEGRDGSMDKVWKHGRRDESMDRGMEVLQEGWKHGRIEAWRRGLNHGGVESEEGDRSMDWGERMESWRNGRREG